jgi:predicted kinase
VIKPKLIVMSGLPGSGKSTLAERLAVQLKAPILSVDPIESAIIKAGIARSFKTGYAAYLVAESLAEEQIKLGNTVIVDAVNAEDEGKQMWINCAQQLKVPLLVIECVLKDEALHRERIEGRVRGLHGIEEINWEKVQARRKKYTPWKLDILTLEMSKNIDNNLEAALAFIVGWRSEPTAKS